MCLAIPAKIIKINGGEAEVDMQGIRREANISLLDKIRKGDYVLLHAGFAIQKIDAKSALETLKIFREINEKTDINSAAKT